MRALRYSLRSLARNPAFSAVIVLLLAFGMGANTLIFTAVDVLLLRDLPVDHPEQLVRMEEVHPSGFRSPLPQFPDYYRPLLSKRAKSFGEVFSAGDLDMSFQAAGRVENVSAKVVSGNYYRALGAHAQIGRTIVEDDDRAGMPYPVVLSHSFWRRAFGSRANVLGESIRLRGVPFTIVGVMPGSFRGLDVEGGPDVAIPVNAYYLWTTGRWVEGAPVEVFGRLKPDVSLAQANAEVQTLHPGLVDAELEKSPPMTAQEKQHLLDYRNSTRIDLQPVSRGVSKLRKQFAVAVEVLMGAVGVLLLLVCANIAGLMLARGEAARKEIAVRLSLGATRFTVASQLMTDALVLSFLGAAGAMLIARWGGPVLLAFLPSRRPLTLELTPDARVLAFAAGACIVTALAMSIVPALHLFRADLTGLMGRGGPCQRRSFAGIGLVALQVALSTMLLIGGAALVRTLNHLRSAHAGVNRRNLIAVVVNPRMAGVKTPEMKATIEDILRRAKELPGVEGATLAEMPLMRGIGMKNSIAPTGVPIKTADFLNTSMNDVSLGHFENVGIRLLAGRDFRPADVEVLKPLPVVVSESFVRRFFPNVDPIGKTFGTGMNVTAGAEDSIIGVVSDTKYRSMREDPPPVWYRLIDKDLQYIDTMGVTLHVRTSGSPGVIIAELRAMLSSVGPGIAPSEVATVEQDIETSLWQERLIAALASVFAIASAVLVAIGLYGMLAYSIARRTREIGIRMALGARPAHMIEMISRDVIFSVAPGLILGVAVYAACARIISPVLYGVRPMDAISIAVSIALIAFVAAMAGFVPARRAIAIEPSEALRQE
jgi:predicted permease